MENLAEKTFDLLEASGLNWSVNKVPLVTKDGLHPTESFGIMRNDNNRWLGTVGKVYEPLQNAKMAEILLEAADGLNLPVERGGLLNGGKKVYMQIGLPDDFVGKSEVQRWISGLNHHNSDGSIGFGSTNTVVVCRNTFAMAFGDLLKFRHTTTAVERIEIAMKSLRHALGLEEKQIENFKVMANTSISEALFSKVIKACFNVGLESTVKDTSAVQRNKLIQVNNAIEKEIELEGATLWGLFNGITRYTNHIAATKDRQSF
jgi:phage/plasmid-like protein (TIGR03299 family)